MKLNDINISLSTFYWNFIASSGACNAETDTEPLDSGGPSSPVIVTAGACESLSLSAAYRRR